MIATKTLRLFKSCKMVLVKWRESKKLSNPGSVYRHPQLEFFIFSYSISHFLGGFHEGCLDFFFTLIWVVLEGHVLSGTFKYKV